MSNFAVRSSSELTELLQAFRKQTGLKQSEVATRLGVTQQTISALERNADKVSADRLLQLLNILGVEMILRKVPDDAVAEPPSAQSTPLSPAGRISTDKEW
ncbi:MULTISPECIES: helix-turn-helix transcriptional regulator [Pandoraea]|uniref:helix-turn-helix domain-containing protein n=1 Tax=Pandoraea TaxID=93217 RepID=UPI001F5E30BE|nr:MULTISPECIES: helix-turn-helix transcriptional regulator [Pandoraea]MCI3208161.1 XRE family transcriptional regulator [Pandoraea sp. LA3]MDN4586190.1 XRE family transcriptional regulator [Pandoraea capi]